MAPKFCTENTSIKCCVKSEDIRPSKYLFEGLFEIICTKLNEQLAQVLGTYGQYSILTFALRDFDYTNISKTTYVSNPDVNFINVLRAHFWYKSLFWQLFLVTFCLWRKIRTINVPVKRWWNRRLNVRHSRFCY